MKNYGLSNFNSFLLALAIYLCVVVFVFFKLVHESELATQYTDIKDSFIDIELADFSKPSPKNTSKHMQKSSQQVDIEKLFAQTTNKAVKTENIDQKASDFNELFGNIKQMQEEKTTKIQSSAKSDSLNSLKPQASELVKQLNDSLLEEESLIQGESIKVQKKGIYDEFLGKVVRIITQRWSQYYPSSDKISVKVRIFIDENGNFGYTSVEKSGNPLYDAKVAEFLENQKGKFIAYPPQNKNINIIMNLKDEVKVKNDEEKK
ncbi:TonB C-terminal domain-containing protein [Campylobacter sp. VicNov18]|uniref:TonB C-terminal domain-containing protein n=1 Tax=Campylobacter bilis TaxID=2691918 RepID=UPI00130E9EF2|nr:TonB C-terminal domain-containing protein [Campylobacter bilis]MPV63035.1 energy transducer TonB [Campylobacter hepaticus]MBM0636534.1 energy transducer TonB [Campylobacter bilis]MCC8277244.1 TonB C-terminal domain-containing protein [Campylobacter bilis]MCC8298987.1 TonB C-terminal domain-containing protein [Campylobacter bilis]MCC8300153.1 TonB C-terminal domain-containing protein [Campylobacter bilis]